MSEEPEYTDDPAAPWVLCECGAIVGDKVAHNRFHSILSSHAWALAVLETAHLAAHIHERYDVHEKVNSRTFDNWSADALAQVMHEHGLDEPEAP